MKKIEIPIIINGSAIYPSDERENYEISYATGTTVVIPKASESDLKKIKEKDRFCLHDIHYQDIINALVKIGKFWSVENSDHPIYQKAIKYLSMINGYDLKMAQRELNIINVMCSFGDTLHDMLNSELGNKFYLEEWIPVEDALVHAQPQGNVVNVMVGNVPVSSIMSLVRCLITKNRTIAKLPKRDPITSTFFVLSFLEILKDHPVTKSIDVLYWPGGDPLEDEMLDIADVVCVWGGQEAVRGIKAKAHKASEIIEFGPKTSFALVGKESSESKKVAIDLAHDISIYNQEACFSPQFVFVEGNISKFSSLLAEGLELYRKLLPKGFVAPDISSNVNRSRMKAKFLGSKVTEPKDAEWTIIEAKNPEEITDHPLNRTIYVISVDHLTECLKYVNRNTQTITISPWGRNSEIRDKATLYGASKVTEIGLAEWQRIGAPHDNVYPLHKMVKWVGLERGLDYLGKHIENGPVDTTLYLMMVEGMLEEYENGELK